MISKGFYFSCKIEKNKGDRDFKATARKASFENKNLRNCDYFSIVPSCSHFTMLTKNAKPGLVYASLN